MAEDTQTENVSATILSNNNIPHVNNENSSLQSYFGVEDGDATDKLDTIREFLRGDKKEYSEFDLMSDLRGLVNKLGSAPIGTSQLMQVYTYAKLASQAKSIEEELKGMVR